MDEQVVDDDNLDTPVIKDNDEKVEVISVDDKSKKKACL